MARKSLLFITLFFSLAASAQNKQLTDKDYARKPYWIQLMDLESVNFNEAVKAFDIYWQNHQMPEEEGDRVIGKNQPVKPLSRKEIREIREGDEMRFQIKRFRHWVIINEPFVKPDGFTMTAEEKLRFHNQH